MQGSLFFHVLVKGSV